MKRVSLSSIVPAGIITSLAILATCSTPEQKNNVTNNEEQAPLDTVYVISNNVFSSGKHGKIHMIGLATDKNGVLNPFHNRLGAVHDTPTKEKACLLATMPGDTVLADRTDTTNVQIVRNLTRENIARQMCQQYKTK